MIRPTRNTELENSMDLFSGGRAISENLQLNRELRLSTDEQNRIIPVSSVTGITIDEIKRNSPKSNNGDGVLALLVSKPFLLRCGPYDGTKYNES